MPALTLRPAPLDRVAVLRALPAVVIAVAGGAWLALVIAVAFGVDLGSGEAAWIGVAGACACLSGLMVGGGANVAAPAVFGVAAIAAVVLAADAAREAAPVREAAFPARADTPPAASGETRAQAGGETRGQASGETRRQARPETSRQTGRQTSGQTGGQTGGQAGALTGGQTAALTVAGAGALVGSYYAAIDSGDFAAAWDRLSPAVQARFGGFDRWRAGYATTIQQQVEGVEVDGGVIRYVLVATDRTPCGGTTEQRFSVAWTVADGRASALHAVKLAGQDPAAAC